MSIKNTIIVSSIVAVIVLTSSIVGGILLTNKVKKSTIVYKGESAKDIIEQGSNKNDNELNGNINVDEPSSIAALSNLDANENEVNKDSKDFDTMNISILGEIMMGGTVTNNVDYIYTSAFKNIYMSTNDADFTYANFSTNITNLEKIENAKSKYLVTKSVISGLKALGLDCVSIASDHICDYDKDIVNNTINTLEDNEIFVAGREDMPVYFEKGSKKIAIVSTNAVFIGTAKNYTKLGISAYTDSNIVKNINEAKKSADIVIADIHWGKEYNYGVTEQMRQISKVAIDAGADMVIGSHAAGVYPLESYKGKPIIFSTGYFIGDSDLYVGHESFIFNIKISKENKIEQITMTPIYIKDKKEVLPYQNYSLEQSNKYLEMYNKWHQENGFDSNIVSNQITVRLS